MMRRHDPTSPRRRSALPSVLFLLLLPIALLGGRGAPVVAGEADHAGEAAPAPEASEPPDAGSTPPAAPTAKSESSDPLAPYDGEAIRRIKKRGELVIAQFNGARPGFFTTDESRKENPKAGESPYNFEGDYPVQYEGKRLVGKDIDLAHRLAQSFGVKTGPDGKPLRDAAGAPVYKVKPVFKRTYSFNGTCVAVNKGEADLAITKLSLTPRRQQAVLYTRPYVSLRKGLLINRKRESELRRGESVADLLNGPGADIGVIANTSFVEYFNDDLKRKYPQARMVAIQGEGTAKDRHQKALFQAALQGFTERVVDGRSVREPVLAVFYDEYEIERAFRLNPDMRIYCRSAYLEMPSDDIAIAVGRDHPQLLAYVDLILDREGLRTTPEKILEKYHPEGEPPTIRKGNGALAVGADRILSVAMAVVLLVAYIVLARRRPQASAPTGGRA